MRNRRFLAVAGALLAVAACSEQQSPEGMVAPSFAVGGNSGSSASGHINFTVDGGLQTLSFHARSQKQGTSGDFEVFSRGQDIQLHGTIDCINVVGNEAALSGVVTNSKEGFLPVGTQLLWVVRDNGEGAGSTDVWTDLLTVPEPCTIFPPGMILAKVPLHTNEDGNVQVRP